MKLSPRTVCTVCLVCACSFGLVPVATAGETEAELVEISGAQAMLDRGLPADHPPFMSIRPLANAQATDEQPDDYGTLNAGYTTVRGLEFKPAKSIGLYSNTSHTAMFCESASTYAWFDAQFEPPIGAEITGIRVWTYDNSAEDMYAWIWEICQPNTSAGEPTDTELEAEKISSGTPGEDIEWMNITDRTANTYNCVYLLRVRFGDDTNCNGSALRLHKARMQWRRQVSPAPATATFNDVGTGHIFFRYVEALADSDITAGCGGGSFCPDAPLSRGQMAVFLSKALGLHWAYNSF